MTAFLFINPLMDMQTAGLLSPYWVHTAVAIRNELRRSLIQDSVESPHGQPHTRTCAIVLMTVYVHQPACGHAEQQVFPANWLHITI